MDGIETAGAGPRSDAKTSSQNAALPSALQRTKAKSENGEDVREVGASLLCDFVFEAMAPVEADSAAVRLSLKNDDDAGARYHLKRVVECVRAAACTFRELEALKAGPSP